MTSLETDIDKIVNYNMTGQQAMAYKVGLLWLYISRKLFPNYKHGNNYPKKGDPRKCLLFQYSYKLVRDTYGLMSLIDYNLYIQAQLDIIKANSAHPMISPQCLVGDAAWIRWRVWKTLFDKKMNKNDEIILTPLEAIVGALKRTKAFLFGRFDGQPTEKQIANADIGRLVSLGKVSPFYVLLSPWMNKTGKISSIDMDLYNNSITDAVRKEFCVIFPYEHCDNH